VSDARLGNVSAALLTGGAATGIGSDKAHLTLGGEAIATRIARLLAGLFEELLLVGGDPPREASGRRIPDAPGPRCALRGVVAGLGAARSERVLLVATDLPLLTPDLVLALVAWPAAEAVVPRSADGMHPLCALYRREPALALAREQLAAERLPLRDWVAGLDTSYLEPADLARVDPEGLALTNVNTPGELARVREQLE
jgi:molybdopterin-guanine dinucleotide biosynthesis protein A